MNNQENNTNEIFSKKNLRSILMSLIVVLSAVLVILLAYVALGKRDTLIIKDPVYIVVNGTKIYYENGVELKHNDEGTILNYDGHKANVEDKVLMDEEKGYIILQRSGTVNRTDTDGIYRADYYTCVAKDENGDVCLKRRNKKSTDVSGVVYDNKDTYIFLEEATLKYADKTVEIKPMTVVEVSYLSHIQIYSLGNEPEFEYLESEIVMATFADGKRVNLATDRFYQKDGTWRLMHLPLDVLKSWQ